jgi:hypothetical protein
MQKLKRLFVDPQIHAQSGGGLAICRQLLFFNPLAILLFTQAFDGVPVANGQKPTLS